jgi:hypothetical protein
LQWTGINTVIFYAPQLFISLGTGQRAALLATIVTGVVNHFATYVSLWAADSFGRRILFLEGGVQMLLALVRFWLTMCEQLETCSHTKPKRPGQRSMSSN